LGGILLGAADSGAAVVDNYEQRVIIMDASGDTEYGI
jgi:hypothetical protein